MKVGIICRRNLVRSAFLESFLSNSFPTIKFWSAGMNVIDSSHYEFDPEIRTKFGIKNSRTGPVNLKSKSDDLINTDLLLVADSSLLTDYKQRGIKTKVVFLDEIGNKLGLLLRDPIGFSPREMESQLYLHAFVASSILSKSQINVTSTRKIVGLIPNSINAFPRVSKMVEKVIFEKNGIILQTCIGKSPYVSHTEFKSIAIPNRFLNSFSSFIFNQNEERIFHFEHEVVNPTLSLTSPKWRQNIEILSEKFNLYCASAPLNTSTGALDFNSYLGVLPASSFEIVAD